jgi:hypothetical protein
MVELAAGRNGLSSAAQPVVHVDDNVRVEVLRGGEFGRA